MFNKSLISETIPIVSIDEPVTEVLKKMQKYDVSELPIIKSKKLVGLISKSDISGVEDKKQEASKYASDLDNVYVKNEQLFLDAVALVAKFKLSLVPVTDNNDLYLGSILTRDLLAFFAKFAGINEHGGLIVLEMNINDYVLTEIAQIVESNNAKIVNLYVSYTENSSLINVTLKLNTADLSPVIQTLERYEYTVKYRSVGDDILDNFYNERFHEFINYLNV